jgi:hypothetical protein
MSVDLSAEVPAYPPKKSRWWVWLLGGCGCLTLVAVAAGLAMYFGVRAITAGPEQVVQDFLAAAGAGNAVEAHGYFSQPLQAEQPLEELSRVIEERPHLFRVTDTTFTSRSRDGSRASFSGTVTLERGTRMPASFVLVKENDDWRLLSYEIGE